MPSNTRGQSNLAKAASNARHTLHSQDSVATAVPGICKQSQPQNFKSLASAVAEI